MKKRFVSILVVFCLVILCCPATFAQEEPVQIKWFCIDNSSGSTSLNSDMAVWQELGRRNNLRISIEGVAQSDLTQKYNLYLASGDMPDVMQAPNADTLNQYGMAGAFVALDEHLDKMPNVKKYLESDEALRSALTAGDGHIYALSEYRPFPNTEPNPLLRADWLTNLGLEAPQTIDEWYAVLKAFKEQDANGNGDPNDEIPYSGFFGGIVNFTDFLKAFGVIAEFYPDAEGNYRYWYTSEEMRDCVTWLHQLYEEGLIDSDIASNDQTVFDQKFDNDTVGAFRGYFFTSMINKNKLAESSILGINLVGTPPIRSANGEYHITTSEVALCFYAINASSPYIDQILSLYDYIWSEEGILLTTMGIEGETWIRDEQGEPIYTDKILNNPEGMSGTNALRTYGALNGMPYVHTPMYRIGLYPQSLRDMAQSTYDQWSSVAEYPIIVLAFTEEETSENSSYLTDIQTYANEMLLKFIYGQASLDQWDAYAQSIQDMGIDQVLANYQAAYDRK